MNIKAIATSALIAFGAMSTMASAASCTLGTCDVVGSAGQNLSDTVLLDVNNIVNDTSGTFTFASDFVNDNGSLVAVNFSSVLAFVPQGAASFAGSFIRDLTMHVLGNSYAITDANGSSVGDDAALTGFHAVKIDLSGSSLGDTVAFFFTGDAEPSTLLSGKKGNPPNFQIAISAVPLPAGFLLLGSALGGLTLARRRQKKA